MTPTRTMILTTLTLCLALLTGCATLEHWGRVALIEGHAAADDILSVKTNQPTVVVPVTPGKPSVAATGDLCDPYPGRYNSTTMNWEDESRRGFIGSQECGVEPAYGLLIRCPTWVPSKNAWYMLSDPYKGGRIKLEGSRDNGTLVCGTFTSDGFTFECVGAADHELHANQGDTLEAVLNNLKFKGNRIPYKHTRLYLVWLCHQAK